MNDIDQILSNIDKDDDNLFQGETPEGKHNEEISELIDSIESRSGRSEVSMEDDHAAYAESEKAGTGHEEPAPSGAGAAHDEGKPGTLDYGGGVFSLRGTKNWNRHEPYLIQVDAAAYRSDVESLQKSFFFVEDAADQEAMKQKIKQEIVAFLRKPTGHVTDQYADFICKKISLVIGELAENFKLDQETEKLFVYHLGPLTVYKYLKDDFYHNKYGYCYKYLPGNKAARFFPDEYIKATVLKWFEENINTLTLPFDSIQKYEEMKKIASRRYYHDLRTFNIRLDQLNAKLGAEKSISRIKLFQVKGNQWFGRMNLEVYRRFIGGTIFM